MIVLAHSGHWLIWVLYAVPLLIVVAAIAVNAIRGRRSGHQEAREGDPPEQGTG